MIIKKAYIINFGKLSNENISFDEGINSYIKDNGEGKSTLAAFIKAMLYGLETWTANSKDFKDRQHYAPFNGNTFGGNLVIEFNGKEYKIVREFDKKSITKDKLIIYDDKNKEIDSIDGTPIDYNFNCGEYFLGIDKEAFEKCNFIYSNDLDVEINDSIKHKLNDLVIESDSQNTYTKVIDLINDDLKIRKKTTKGFGDKKKEEIKVLSAENDELRKKIDNIHDVSLPELEEYYEDYKSYTTEYENTQKEKESCDKKIIDYNNFKVFKSYENDINKTISQRDDILKKYPNGLMSKEDSNTFKKLLDSQKSIDGVINDVSLTKDDKEFLEYFEKNYKKSFGIEDIDALTKKNIQIHEKRDQLNKLVSNPTYNQEEFEILDDKFEDNNLISIDELTSEIHNIKSLKETIDEDSQKLEEIKDNYPSKEEVENANENIKLYKKYSNDLQQLENDHDRLPKFINILLIILTLGIYLIVLTKKDNSYRLEKEELEKEIQDLETQISDVLKRYDVSTSDYDLALNRLTSLETAKSSYELNSSSLDKKKITYEKEYEKYASYFMKFGYSESQLNVNFNNYKRDYYKYIELNKEKASFEINVASKKDELAKSESSLLEELNSYNDENISPDKKLLKIKKDLVYKNECNKKIQSLSKEMKKQEAVIDSIQTLLTKYSIESNGDLDAIYFDTINDKNNLNTLKDNIESQKVRMEQFCKEHDFSENLDLTSIEEEKANLIKKSNDLQQKIRNLDNSIKSLENEIQNEDRFIQNIEDNEEKIEKLEHDVDIYQKTKEYIEVSEHKLEDKYIKPVKSEFVKYANLLKENFGENTKMDFDYNITKDIDGRVISLKYLSDGEKSMILLALRFAVIDNLYKEEKTFLVLDDPFVYLDMTNFTNMKKLINNVVPNKQIIYFTCHDSRDIG